MLVCRCGIDFCILTLYPATLLNSLINLNNLSLFSTYESHYLQLKIALFFSLSNRLFSTLSYLTVLVRTFNISWMKLVINHPYLYFLTCLVVIQLLTLRWVFLFYIFPYVYFIIKKVKKEKGSSKGRNHEKPGKILQFGRVN